MYQLRSCQGYCWCNDIALQAGQKQLVLSCGIREQTTVGGTKQLNYTESSYLLSPRYRRQDTGALWAFQKEIGPDLSLLFDFNTQRPKTNPPSSDTRLYTAGKTQALILAFLGMENKGSVG